MKAKIFDVQSFCTEDGPGIRTTVFFKGCNLSCVWCHNPESQNSKSELRFVESKCIGCRECLKVCPKGNDKKTAIFTHDCCGCFACVNVCYSGAIKVCGYDTDEDELMEIIMRDAKLYEQSGGGVTFSGGEPLLQKDFLCTMLKKCKNAGVHTAVETALNVKWEDVEEVLENVSLIYCDLKAFDSNKHKELTGKDNSLILENILKLDRKNIPFVIRIPVVPSYNTDQIEKIAEFVRSLNHKVKVELLAFHGLCSEKYKTLNRHFALSAVESPSKQLLDTYMNLFETEVSQNG